MAHLAKKSELKAFTGQDLIQIFHQFRREIADSQTGWGEALVQIYCCSFRIGDILLWVFRACNSKQVIISIRSLLKATL